MGRVRRLGGEGKGLASCESAVGCEVVSARSTMLSGRLPTKATTTVSAEATSSRPKGRPVATISGPAAGASCDYVSVLHGALLRCECWRGIYYQFLQTLVYENIVWRAVCMQLTRHRRIFHFVGP